MNQSSLMDRAVLRALADPMRQRIVELLAAEQLCTCHLVEDLDATQTNVSNHLRVLREAGLVQVREDGRRRVYALDPAPLDELEAWLARTRKFWTGRLDALERELRRRKGK